MARRASPAGMAESTWFKQIPEQICQSLRGDFCLCRALEHHIDAIQSQYLVQSFI